MENKSHALAAGIFVVLVTAMAITFAVWLSHDRGQRHLFELSTRESVTGLQPQAAVRYRGLAVGKVESIAFDDKTPGNVRVRLSVDEGTPLTRSTFATLGYQGVTGLAYVQLDDPGDSTEPLRPDDSAPPRIPLRPGLFSKLTDQGDQIVAQLNQGAQRFNQMLSPDNQKEFVGAVQQLGAAARGVEQLSARLGVIMDAQLGPERVNIPQLVQETRTTLQALQITAAEATRTAAEVGKTAGELTLAARQLNEKGGTLARLGESADALAASTQTLNARTLPRIHRATDDTARAARQTGQAFSTLNDNPQSLLWGHGVARPGPGEPGFAAPAAQP